MKKTLIGGVCGLLLAFAAVNAPAQAQSTGCTVASNASGEAFPFKSRDDGYPPGFRHAEGTGSNTEQNASLSDVPTGERHASLSDVPTGERHASLSDVPTGERHASLSDVPTGERHASLSDVPTGERHAEATIPCK